MNTLRIIACFLLLVGQIWAQGSLSSTQIRAAADYSRSKAGLTFLLWQDGNLLLEESHNGGSTSDYYELASGTKSFSGVIAAAAIADGFLRLDEFAADTLTEWKSDPKRSRITVRMLLHLTSGLAPHGNLNTPTYAAAVATNAVEEPGTKFVYDPVHFQVFGELMRRKLLARGGGSPVEYLKTRVLDRIGLSVGNWRHGQDGNPQMPAGAQLAAREWIKFGEFMRLDGNWKGTQIIPADLLRELHNPGPVNPGYGLTFWLNHPIDPATASSSVIPDALEDGILYPGGPVTIYVAAGLGDQRLYIIPHLNVVVVRQAPVFNTSDFTDEAFLQHLVPPTGVSTLLNLSTRGRAGSGEEALVGGFVISGSGAKSLLLRAAGPALRPLGVTTAAADPMLRVYDAAGRALLQNDNWSAAPNDEAQLIAAFKSVGAFSFPTGSNDAALLVSLSPGAYTVHVTPSSGAPGIALVEVYQMPE